MTAAKPEHLPAVEHRAQLELLLRTLRREAHILIHEPEVLASHLHNMLYLDEGEVGLVGPLLARAREALVSRPWLRLTNRPAVGVTRSALLWVGEHGTAVNALAWSPDGRTIISGGDGRNGICIWDAVTGRMRANLESSLVSVKVMALFDGARLGVAEKRFVASTTFVSFELWDIAMGRRIAENNAAVLGEAIAWSPFGALLAIGDPQVHGFARFVSKEFRQMPSDVTVWDVEKGKVLSVLKGHRGWVEVLAWANGGQSIASGGTDGTVRLWKPSTGRLMAAFAGDAGWVKALAWSPDDALLASGHGDGTIRLCDPTTGKQQAVLKGRTVLLDALAWSRDSRTLAAADEHQQVRLWDPVGERLRAVLHDVSTFAYGRNILAWAPDSDILAASGPGNTVQLWNGVTGKPICTLRGHLAPVTCLAWSNDGLLASGGKDGSLRVWDVRGVEILEANNLRGRHYASTVGGFSPEGKTLAVISRMEHETLFFETQRNSVILCDSITGRTHGELKHVVPLSVRLRPRGLLYTLREFATAAVIGGIYLLLLKPFGGEKGFTTNKLRALAWDSDGCCLASGGDDGVLRLWDPARRSLRRAFILEPITALSWSPVGHALAWASKEHSGVLNAVTGRREYEFKLSRHQSISEFVWAPSGTLVASVVGWGVVSLWDLAREPRPVVLHDAHRPLAWAPNGRWIASVGASWREEPKTRRAFWDKSETTDVCHYNIIKLYDVAAGCVAVSIEFESDITAINWAPTSELLVVAIGKSACLLDASNGQRGPTLAEHTKNIAGFQWSPDGSILVSWDKDDMVCLWSRNGRLLTKVHCLAPVITSQFSADGRLLRAADNGAATGNWPIPYIFELCNVEIGLPVGPPVAPPTRPSEIEHQRTPWWVFWRRK